MSAALPVASFPARIPRRVLPGFGLSLGYTILYLSLIVLIPLVAIFTKTAELGWSRFVHVISSARVVAALALSFGTAGIAALFNAFAGLLVAWVLARHDFPARRLVDALVDLPFALPTAVAGIALTAVYAPAGPLGKLLGACGITVVYTPLGIIVALMFIGLPFVVRMVQPVLEELDREVEEAARTLGAGPRQIFLRIVLPAIWPALLTGFALAFARGIGEYGSVIFIAGNMPMRSEIAPLLIVTKLEQYEYASATAIAVVMLVISFVLLLGINALQGWSQRRLSGAAR
jgi:sulfate transport system permease protein